jgi:dipeptidyl aminopeptidase/acylaminoacyl peptidase
MIHLERLLRVPHVEVEMGFDLSPDGATVAFSWNLSGRWELYALPIDRSTDPQLLLPGPGNRFNPQFSPTNPNIIACVADLDGSENFHLLRLDLSSAEWIDLTPGDTLQPYFAWSPDGKQLAFISNRSSCFDVYILDLETRQERLACALGHPAWKVTWSPDGRWLAVTAETTGSDYGIYLIKLVSKVSRPSTRERPNIFDTNLNAKDPCWSKDSKKLAFCATHDEFYQIGVFDVASRQINWLTEGEGNKTSPAWDASGERLVYLHNQGAANHLVVSAAPFSIAPGFHSLPRFMPNGQDLLFLFENPQNPPDLWSFSIATGSSCQLSTSLPAEIDKNELPMPVEIYYPSLDEGIQVPALLYEPENLPAPAVVNIHGGPTWHFSLSWNPFMTHFASLGWVVLAPNYRGSTGYGHTWQTANFFDLGGCDTRDVAAGAMYLANEGLAIPGYVAITGRSHGGYLTMTCLTQYPDLWATGSGVVPFFDMFVSHYASREDLQHWNIENMGDPVEYEDLWRERSPFFFLDRVNVPVQIICSSLDPRCPVVDSLAARDRLLALGKSVDFVLYPDEGHEFLKMENILDSETRRVEFLVRALDDFWVELNELAELDEEFE